jgi:beta-lactamase regulating signal transducer with metallopeptidase domain
VWSGLGNSVSKGFGFISPGRSLQQRTKTDSRSVAAVLEKIKAYAAFTLIFGILISLAILGFRLAKLRKFLLRQPQVKVIRGVQVLVTSESDVPFSAGLLGQAFVIIPAQYLENRTNFRIVRRHEFQHIRNRDTQWLYLYELLKVIFFWNPAVYRLARTLSEIQEFACDESVVGHRGISPHAYGRCLIEAAETAVQSQHMWVGTARMAVHHNGNTLKRRIEMLVRHQKKSRRMGIAVLTLFFGTLMVMASIAYASRSAIEYRALSMTEGQELVERAANGTVVPIDMNELVLARLNRFIGTAEGRKWVREALGRMSQYKPMIDRKTKEYGLPEELIATAMYESGFQNDLASPPPYQAAGIWQFIPQTARKYNLIVNDRVDERLNAEKETDAAMRYLSDLFNQFQDWRLALKAYNEGESHVAQLIEKYGTRDPWTLERDDSRESYLSGAIAMIIIYKNPSLLH